MYSKESKRDNKTSASSCRPKQVLIGTGFAVVISLILFMVVALIMTGESMPDSSIRVLGPAAGLIGVFIGGFVAAFKNKKSGLLTGVFTGLAVFAVLFVLSMIFRNGDTEFFSLKTLFTLLAILLASVMGGVVGVNIKRRR